ncbi:hypothetical protein HK100_001256 [Physocladia obscura]|uniref:Uncharacterized protein n=1 Tax=Physocladia obscura TaxID=109957 RepID=A0AAD5XEZ7_9FUNG|nr:hypothetical protein HK100_001256 [Physocladia obscura]
MKLLFFALGSIAALVSALPDIADVHGVKANQDSKPAAGKPSSPGFSNSHAGPNINVYRQSGKPHAQSHPGLGKAPYGGYYNDDYYGYSDYDSYGDDYNSYNDYDSYGYERKKRDVPYGGDYGYGYNDYNNYYSGYNSYGDDDSYGYGYGRK